MMLHSPLSVYFVTTEGVGSDYVGTNMTLMSRHNYMCTCTNCDFIVTSQLNVQYKSSKTQYSLYS